MELKSESQARGRKKGQRYCSQFENYIDMFQRYSRSLSFCDFMDVANASLVAFFKTE